MIICTESTVKGLPKDWIWQRDVPWGKWFFWHPHVWNGDYDEHGYAVLHEFAYLRLPSWGMLCDISMDEDRWGQRVLIWHGRKGFRMGAYFPP